MTDFTTAHYDLEETRGKQMIVLDTFKRVAESIANDVIPASREDVAISGIENPASSLSSSGNKYTTLPLRPVSKDVNFIYNNYLHGRFQLTFSLHSYSDSAATTAADLPSDLSVAIHAQPLTQALPSRIQLMCGNSIIWQNQFQRQEALVSFASLPQELVETSNECFTCSKAVNHHAIPGSYQIIGSSQKIATGIYSISFIHDFTIDLNRLTPLLSNLPFTLIQSGDLRLRVFFENLEEAYAITPLNDTNNASLNETNFHVISPQPMNKLFAVKFPTTQAIASASNTIAAGTAGASRYITADLVSWQAVDMGLEIIQSNFSIKTDSLRAISDYLKTDNKFVIPTQTWSTSLATNKPTSQTGEIVWQISAYNIYLLAFLFPYDNAWTTYSPTPPLTSIDIMLNSKSINYLTYKNFDGRVIKDTIQAFVNDDKYGANESLLESLNLPIASDGSGYDATAYLTKFSDKGGNVQYSPNTFVIAKGLSPPNCFEKGYCYASSNPQNSQVRFKYQWQTGLDNGSATNTLNANMALTATNAPPMCLALQDCCLVLNYDPVNDTCQSGSIIFAEPSVI